MNYNYLGQKCPFQRLERMSMAKPDYYETLELGRNASQDDIKEAYRNLSLKYHPSKAPAGQNEVYEIHFQIR